MEIAAVIAVNGRGQAQCRKATENRSARLRDAICDRPARAGIGDRFGLLAEMFRQALLAKNQPKILRFEIAQGKGAAGRLREQHYGFAGRIEKDARPSRCGRMIRNVPGGNDRRSGVDNQVGLAQSAFD